MLFLSQLKKISKSFPLLIIAYLCFGLTARSIDYSGLFLKSYNIEKCSLLELLVMLVPYILLIFVVETFLYILNKNHLNMLALRYKSVARLKIVIIANLAGLIITTETADCIIYFLFNIHGNWTSFALVMLLFRIFEKLSLGMFAAAVDMLFNRYLIGSCAALIIALFLVLSPFLYPITTASISLIIILLLSMIILVVKKNIFII